MRKGRDRGKTGKKKKREKKEEKKREKTDENSGHYVIASSRLPERNRPNNTAQTTTAGMPHARANLPL